MDIAQGTSVYPVWWMVSIGQLSYLGLINAHGRACNTKELLLMQILCVDAGVFRIVHDFACIIMCNFLGPWLSFVTNVLLMYEVYQPCVLFSVSHIPNCAKNFL